MCIYDDSRRFARLEWRLHDTFVARAAHKLLDLWQDAGDDRVDARGGRMKAVALIEPGFTGNAVEEERVKQKIAAGGEAAHDLGECLARDLRIDAAQHVVGAELDDDRIGPLRHRPVEAGEATGSGIAGDPRIGDLDREALGPE